MLEEFFGVCSVLQPSQLLMGKHCDSVSVGVLTGALLVRVLLLIEAQREVCV